MSASDWKRVSRAEPCPVCEHPDWCLVSTDGTAAICPRTESAKRVGDAGFLHRLTAGPRVPDTRRFTVPFLAPATDLSALAARYRAALSPDRLADFATTLGLSVDALTAFRVGWSAEHIAWAFPMSEPVTGRVVGIRLRSPGWSKFAVTGGRDGLFVPAVEFATDAPLLVAEGPTDAAALLDFGFPNVVGRPSCTGGTKHLVALVRATRPAEVVIVADRDERGLCGASRLSNALAAHAPRVKTISPPDGVKDARAWKLAGAIRTELEDAIRATATRTLTISTRLINRRTV
jgi:hypothetical protein